MAEYIKREDAIDAICGSGCPCKGEEGCVNKDCVVYNISKVPSADVVERKKGKWEWAEFISFNEQLKLPSCSLCRFVFTSRYNYCPNCGAEMVGE